MGKRSRGNQAALSAAALGLTVLLMILALPLALDGCGKKQVGPEPEKTRLELWYYWDVSNARKCLSNLVNEFNRTHPELEVVMKYVPDEDFRKTLALAIADDERPDLAIVDSVDVQYYHAMGALYDVTDCVEEDAYLDLALASCENENGGYSGLPLGLNCLSLYYNTEILGRANVKTPKTLDEFVDAAKRVSSNSVYGCAFSALQSEESIFCFLPVLWAKGGSLDQLASEESAEAFDFLRKLSADGSMSVNSVNMTLTDITREFANEKLAMVFDVSGKEEMIREMNPDIHFQVEELPTGIPSVSVIGGEVLTVMSQQYPEEAEEFLRFMAKPERMKHYLDCMGYLAPRKDLLEWQAEEDYSKRKYIEYLKHAKTREFTPYWPSMSFLVADVIGQVILQEDEPDALNRLAEAISRIREAQNEKK